MLAGNILGSLGSYVDCGVIHIGADVDEKDAVSNVLRISDGFEMVGISSGVVSAACSFAAIEAPLPAKSGLFGAAIAGSAVDGFISIICFIVGKHFIHVSSFKYGSLTIRVV
jgi:hypothetical protein